MPSRVTPTVGATVTVKVDGADISPRLNSYMQQFVFEDSVHLPDVLEITYADPNHAFPEGTPFEIGKEIKVKLHAAGVEDTEFAADITALSGRFNEDGVYTLTVRALDKMHRLHRGRWSKTYEQVKASEVVSQVLSDHGLRSGKIDATDVEYPTLSILGETHFSFLRRLAADSNRVLGFSDGKVNFTERKAPASPLELSPQTSLIDLDITVTGADLTKEVVARGWDVMNKKMVEATANVKATTIQLAKATPEQLVSSLSAKGKTILPSPGFRDMASATAVAKSGAEKLGGAFAEIHAVAHGDPRLRAGSSIELADVPQWFAGKFVLTSTRHVLSPQQGYVTEFTVSGDQDRSLLGFGRGGADHARVTGLAPGLVSDNKDPDDLGRVRVKLPWLADDYATGWARVASLGAGKNRGISYLPAVDDEVLVGFEFGDPDRPYVIGGLWNGQDKLPDFDAGKYFGGGKVLLRGVYSDKQKIAFDDKEGKESITLGMRDKTYLVTIDKGNTTIKVGSDGKVEIEAKDKVMITSKSDVSISATGKFGIDAKGAVSIKGMGVEIVDQAGASLKLQGTAALKGATVAIN